MQLPTMPDFDPALLEDGNEASPADALVGLLSTHSTQMLADGTFAQMCDQMLSMLLAPFEGDERGQALAVMSEQVAKL